MAALKASTAELDIAKTQLQEQDKRAVEYISKYTQDISRFSQQIQLSVANVKKYNSELEALKDNYESGIYSLRGELPNKKQLRDTEKKLETIKQVVQRT